MNAHIANKIFSLVDDVLLQERFTPDTEESVEEPKRHRKQSKRKQGVVNVIFFFFASNIIIISLFNSNTAIVQIHTYTHLSLTCRHLSAIKFNALYSDFRCNMPFLCWRKVSSQDAAAVTMFHRGHGMFLVKWGVFYFVDLFNKHFNRFRIRTQLFIERTK